ncbi:MAG: glucosyl-3-phosphoglycerate synthase [Desulfobacterales bacterium]
MNNTWLEQNTFHHSQFKNLNKLLDAKQRKNLKISLCLPTLNEANTIAKEVVIFKSELMIRYPIVDEIVVIDSGSTDGTREIARAYDVQVFEADRILEELEPYKGKGENLWKALYITNGDIIVYIDADIKNIHHRFAYGLLGPLLESDHIKFSKAFYDRPISDDRNRLQPTGGGRVTELVIRPLFALFFPELTQFLQPLSGEYAAYRNIFENIAFPIGYGVETSMILDIYEKWGLAAMAQVDLDRRVHKNQTTRALGRMAFAIMKTFLRRIQAQGRLALHQDLFQEMIQFQRKDNNYQADIHEITFIERPPIIELPQYREKFGLS